MFDYLINESYEDFGDDAELISEYENKGPKGINMKLLSFLNNVIPSFKRVLKGLEDETLTHQDVDNFSSLCTFILFGPITGGISGTFNGQARFNLAGLKRLLKKANKTREFDSDETEVINKLVDALENWKSEASIDRDNRTFMQKIFLSGRETRDTKRITAATRTLVEKMEECRDIASRHFHGEGYCLTADRLFGYVIND